MKTKHRLRRRAADILHAAHAQLLSRPVLGVSMKTVCAMLAGLVLSLAPLFGRPLPLAAALVAALGFGPAGVGAYLGSLIGYLAVWGLSASLDLVAAGFLILAGTGMFHDLLPQQRRWFVPACAGALYALPGLTCLLGGRVHAFDVAFLLAKLAGLAVFTAAFSSALREDGRGRPALLLALLAGFTHVTLPGGLNLGMILAAGAAFASVHDPAFLLCAVSCGLTLDIAHPQESSVCAMLVFAALICHGASISAKPLRAALFLGCCAAATLFTGGRDVPFFVSALIGTLLALPLPAQLASHAPPLDAPEAGSATQKLEQLWQILSYFTRTLDRTAACDPEPHAAAVFDRAAERVCRSCGKYGVCWNEHAQDTYLALSNAGSRILQRGAATREDLPAFFLERCCHTAGFLAAVNEALEERQCRLQYQARLRENRAILADQYRFLARAIQPLTTPGPSAPVQPPHFTPELGFRARGVRADSVSGDHGCCFSCGEWYYVLLCDGMGTGKDAAEESRTAAKLLRGMILAGFDAHDALQMLNSLYILRRDGGFSTVDLLQLSLMTAEGYLYKWGAPPSYLLCGGAVEKIGTASPPPGLGVGETHQAECVKLSLQREQMLVLVSDGAAGAQTERYLGRCGEQSARELAAGILGCGEAAQTDDQTAVALRLHPSAAWKKHSTSKQKILSKPHI